MILLMMVLFRICWNSHCNNNRCNDTKVGIFVELKSKLWNMGFVKNTPNMDLGGLPHTHITRVELHYKV